MSFSSDKRIYDLANLDQYLTFRRDWANVKSLNPVGSSAAQVTLTRSGVSTRVNEQGLIETVNADLPRFDHDPVTGVNKGLLIEESRVNLLSYSEDFNNAVWGKVSLNVSYDTTTAPDGTTTADSITNTINAYSYFIRTISSQPAGTYTLSFYAKLNGVNCRIYPESFTNNAGLHYFDLSTGTIGGSNTAFTMIPVGNGWYRCICVKSFASPITSIGAIYLGAYGSSPDTHSAYIWGFQLEAGAFPTSYIPTTTNSVTRGADNVSVNNQNVFSRSELSVHCKYRPNAVLVNNRYERVWQLGNSNVTGTIFFLNPGTTIVYSHQAFFNNSITGNAASITQSGEQNTISVVNNQTLSVYNEGALAADNVNFGNNLSSIPDIFYIGSNIGSNALCGHISYIALYNKALSKPLLKALTLS